jgi:hypothetical protein
MDEKPFKRMNLVSHPTIVSLGVIHKHKVNTTKWDLDFLWYAESNLGIGPSSL